jgi:hypothetical protein
VERADGTREFWLDGEEMPFNRWIDALALPDSDKWALYKQLVATSRD